MWQLFQFPLCPFSRKVRLVLAEKGVGHELVRENPWAKDIAVVLNFEARGTSGRSFMFETGPGNLDAARALRSARDATAGSVFATIYRTLPNDTDLSEIAVLGLPALNFAFADGVERYHTSNDDVAQIVDYLKTLKK